MEKDRRPAHAVMLERLLQSCDRAMRTPSLDILPKDMHSPVLAFFARDIEIICEILDQMIIPESAVYEIADALVTAERELTLCPGLDDFPYSKDKIFRSISRSIEKLDVSLSAT